MFARRGADLQQLMGPDAPFIRQHAGNVTVAEWDQVADAIPNTVRVLGNLVLGRREQNRDLCYNVLHGQLHRMWQDARKHAVYLTHVAALRRVKERHPSLVFIPLDKNPGKLAAMCRRQYYQRVMNNFADPSQFRLVAECETVKSAVKRCTDIIFDKAQTHCQEDHFQWGAGKGPPVAFILPKNKMEEEKGKEWKVRTIFSHRRHPLKKRGTLMGRVLSVLVKTASECLHTLELPRTEDILHWVKRMNACLAWSHRTAPNPLPSSADPDWILWELDIKDFYPSLRRQPTVAAVRKVAGYVREATRKRVKKEFGLWFRVHHDTPSLDGLGRGASDQFTNVCLEELMEFLEFEVNDDGFFTVGNRVYEQIKGVAIGGTCSAQLASLYCIMHEHQFYRRPAHIQQRLISTFFDPSMIPFLPMRFRDNLVGLARNVTDLSPIHRFYEFLLRLPLQEEGWGDSLESLEAQLNVTRSGGDCPCIEVSLKDKVKLASRPDPIRRCDRYPDWFSMNARHTLKSLVPCVCKKCLAYASSDRIILENVSRTVTEFLMKGYPTTWWEGLMKHSLLKYGMPPSLHREAMLLINQTKDTRWALMFGPT